MVSLARRPRRGSIKFIATLGAIALVAVASAAASTPPFPAPPKGAIVFARQLGSEDLALGVVPKHGAVLLQASVVDGQGKGVRGLRVAFRAGGVSKAAAACGPGCYRATLKGTRPRVVDVHVRGTRWRVALPAATPDASALVARAEKVWRSLRSVAIVEDLGSGLKPIRSTWRLEAPDRVAYDVRGGWSAIVIGTSRWDRAPGAKRWQKSASTRLTQPVPGWVQVTNAHVLGSGTVNGRPVWRVSFYDPGTPGWFTLSIDKKTLRTHDVWMIATAHFMHDAYGSFNAVPPITPPS